MASKFKPKVPTRERAAAPKEQAEVSAKAEPLQNAPASTSDSSFLNPDSPIVKTEPGLESDGVKLEPMDVDVKLEDMLDDLDVKVKMEGGTVVWDVDDGIKQEVKEEVMTDLKPLGVDRVVREIDVHLTPSIDENTKLYLLQYPLRPYWRPYGVEEKSLEVRVKHEHNKLEVDLLIDGIEENYDRDAESHLKIEKQTLTSTQGNLCTSYAVGILQDNKLYLNPLHAIMQLRPSFKYLDEADCERKKSVRRVESDDEMEEAEPEPAESKPQPVAVKVEFKKHETEKQQQSRLMSYAHLKQLEEAEPWIALEPHGNGSPVTDAIIARMKGARNVPIPFTMRSNEYLKKLVPGRPTSTPASMAAVGGLIKEPLSKSYLDTLPLEKRLLTVLAQGRVHVLQFERLMKLAPAECSEEEVLDVLQRTAYLVQGCWVATSNMRYSGAICPVRDYILLLFVKNRVINKEALEELQVSKEVLREILHPLAVQNVKTGAWEFIESTDKTFNKRHGAIAKDQMQRWLQNEAAIKAGALASRAAALGPRLHLPTEGKPGSVLSTSENPLVRPASTMSPETMEALPGALREIFLKHQVCNLQFIRHCLENLAITRAQVDSSARETAAAAAAAKAPVAELTAAVNQVATSINGVFFLKHLDDPTLDPFREVVVALLRQKMQAEPTAGVLRAETMKAFKMALNKTPSAAVYQKVMKELCYSRGASWVLKTGDGRPT